MYVCECDLYTRFSFVCLKSCKCDLCWKHGNFSNYKTCNARLAHSDAKLVYFLSLTAYIIFALYNYDWITFRTHCDMILAMWHEGLQLYFSTINAIYTVLITLCLPKKLLWTCIFWIKIPKRWNFLQHFFMFILNHH